MKSLVVQKAPEISQHVVVVPNFAEIETLRPLPRGENVLLAELGIADHFVVQYSGNMGRTHALEDLVEVATALCEHPSVHFLFIGWGAKRQWLEAAVVARKLENVTILPHQPRDRLEDVLNACDVAILAFVPGMAGVSVPCRMYNVLAAGKPIIALADKDSELATVINTHEVGWIAQPGDILACANAITSAAEAPDQLRAMGVRARKAAESSYSFDAVLERYRNLVQDVHTESHERSGRFGRTR